MGDTSLDIKRVKHPSIIDHLEPHLVFSDPRLKYPFVTELHARLLQNPESLFILVGYMTLDELRAFLIALNPGPNSPYISLCQLWSKSENPSNWYKPFFARLAQWAVACDKHFIRGETQRSTKAIYRKYGFVPTSTVVRFDLSAYREFLHSQEVTQWATSSNQTSPKLQQSLHTS